MKNQSAKAIWQLKNKIRDDKNLSWQERQDLYDLIARKYTERCQMTSTKVLHFTGGTLYICLGFDEASGRCADMRILGGGLEDTGEIVARIEHHERSFAEISN